MSAWTRAGAWRVLAAATVIALTYALARVVTDSTRSEIPPGLPIDAAVVLLVGAAVAAILGLRLLRP